MQEYILRRLASTIPVLLGISIIVFAMVRAIPGDPAQIMAGDGATLERLERIRHDLGLDQPVHLQYLNWLGAALRGDFGRSIRTNRPVLPEILERLPATLELTLAAIAIAVAFGIALGLVAASRPHSRLDLLATVTSLLGISMPVFWLGLMLLFVFGVWLGNLPIGGRIDSGIRLVEITRLYLVDSLLTGNLPALLNVAGHLILPAVTLSSATLAVTARLTRSSALDVLMEDYVRTARSKGLSERRVLYRHVLKNALIPVITMVGISMGHMLGGAIVTETVFGWPGLGRYLVTAISARDFPVVQAMVLLSALIFVAVNLAVDLLYAYLDPRIRYGRG